MPDKQNADERRRAERYAWLRFESKVCVKRSFFKKEWIPVVPFDFSHYGMGIQTDESYDVGDEVVLSLDLNKEGLTITIPVIKGIMRFKEKHHSRFNYGVEFVFSSMAEKLTHEEDLIRIGQALRQFELARGLSKPGDVASGA